MLQIILYILGAYLLLVLFYFGLQERLIFIPARDKFGGPLPLATPYKEHFFDTPSNGRIHGIKLLTKEAKGIIFYLHGNTGSIKRWGHMGQELVDLGYDVFVMDYRGYGKSTGKRSEEALHNDVRLVYESVVADYAHLDRIIYGRSLGSGFAVPLAATHNPHKLILETPFMSLLDAVQKKSPFLPVGWLLRYPLRSDLSIKDVKCPIIMFHGTRDGLVPYSSAFGLYELVKSRDDVHFISIPDGRHNNLAKYPIFREKLKSFLEA